MVHHPLVVGIGGSNSAESSTGRLLSRCLHLLEQGGARTQLVTGPDLATLPIYDPRDPVAGEVAERLCAAVLAADAVVVATPGYHGGMSGLIKNALDHLEALRSADRPYLEGRAVGVIVSAAGWQACGTTMVSVRSAVHALRGWPTPFGVTVNTVEQRSTVDGTFGPTVDGALDILAGQVLEFTRWQAAARAVS